MTEERRQQRQPRLDIDVLPIPADQRAQHERMADVMYAGLASERLTVQAVGPAEPVELVPDGPFVQSGAGVGDQEARILRAWAKLIADAGVGAERCGRGRVKRNLAFLAWRTVSRSWGSSTSERSSPITSPMRMPVTASSPISVS